MSVICHDLKCIFLHVQRTAGTSITRMLLDAGRVFAPVGLHQSAADLRASDPRQWDEYFTFAVVRNPWDVWVSWYFHRTAKYRIPAAYQNFAAWIRDWQTWYNRHPFVYADQWGLVSDGQRVLVDRLLRFETLEEDLAAVRQCLGIVGHAGLPHLNASKRQADYRAYYDVETRQIVASLAKADIENFGYSF